MTKISSPSDSQELTYTARAGLKSKVFLPNVIGPSFSVFRSGLAACAGATLLFTPGDKLVPPRFIGEVPNPVFEGINKLSLFFILSDHPEAARVIGLILCLASILGASSIGVAWVFYSLHNTAITPDGGDQIGLIASIFCLTLGLARWIIKQFPTRRLGYLLAFYSFLLFKVQVAFVYANAAIAKIRVDNWANGTEVYYDLISPFFGLTGLRQILFAPILASPAFITFLTWGTIAVELYIAAATFASDKWKSTAILAAVFLHGGIALFMGITSFSLTMLTVVIFALLPMKIVGRKLSDIHDWFKLSIKSIWI